MIKAILSKIFNNPYKAVLKNKNIKVAKSAILLKSCTFRFDGKLKNNNVVIGENSMIASDFVFETDSGEVYIGSNTFINAGTSLISRNKIIIGNYVTIAWGCTIYDHNSHSLNYLERREDISRQVSAHLKKKHFTENKNWETVSDKEIVIEDDVWIGFDCVILKGVKIGRGAVIGARSVVRKDVESWTVVAGNPAIVIKKLKND